MADFKASLNVSSGCGRAKDLLFKLTKEQEDPCWANLWHLYHEFNAGCEENMSLNPTHSTMPSFTFPVQAFYSFALALPLPSDI